MTEKYNGWKNYETWNVALWIENDEGLYDIAKGFRHEYKPYMAFVDYMSDNWGPDNRTPDGVTWDNRALDYEVLDEMIKDL